MDARCVTSAECFGGKESDSDERDRLLFELEQCRQDDRDANNRIIQVIIAGIAALAFLFALYSTAFSPNPSDDEGLVPALFFLLAALGIIGAIFSTLASIGIVSALRYRYIKDIEERLRGSRAHVYGWTELSGTVNTLNVYHLRSTYSVAHFLSLVVGVTSAAAVCAMSVALFASSLDYRQVFLIAVAVLPAVFFFGMTIFIASVRSGKMYKRAVWLLMKRRDCADSAGGKSGASKLIAYLLYPRTKDVLKLFFIVLGGVMGASMAGYSPIEALLRILLALFVVDVLVYQARYQWNDIRGAVEDDSNPVAKWRNRLPKAFLRVESAVVISGAVALYKVLLACAIAVNCGEAALPMCATVVAVFLLAALYEAARAAKCTPLVFTLVCLGYPLRVVAGLWVVYPGFFGYVTSVGPPVAMPAFLVTLLVGTALFGLSFVGLTWALEGAERARQGLGQNKGHVKYVAKAIDSNAIAGEYPLKKRGKLLALYNLPMWLSAVLLSAGVAIAGASLPEALVAGVATDAPLLLLPCVAMTLVSVLAAIWPDKVGLHCITLSISAALSAFLLSASFDGSAWWTLAMLSCMCLLLYVGIYVCFRNTNYLEMNMVYEKLGEAVAALLKFCARHVFGESTYGRLRARKRALSHMRA